MNLQTATPAEVDVPLAEIEERISDVLWEDYILASEYELIVARTEQRAKGTYRGYHSADSDERQAERIVTKRLELAAQLDGLRAEAKPYHDEFQRRGGWTRAWLVDNNNGHVHNTRGCWTCNARTRFGWLPQVSGLDESEIVALAGERACTACYPTAPAEVLNNPSALELPRRRAERLAREAEKAEKLAAKTAKSLSLDGAVVTLRWTYDSTKWSRETNANEPYVARGSKELKTYRAAELFVVESLAAHRGSYDASPEVVEEVFGLMAAKRGVVDDEAFRAPYVAKAWKKHLPGQTVPPALATQARG